MKKWILSAVLTCLSVFLSFYLSLAAGLLVVYWLREKGWG